MHPTSDDLAGHLTYARRRIASKQGDLFGQHFGLVGSAECVLAQVTRKGVQGIDPNPVVGALRGSASRSTQLLKSSVTGSDISLS